MNTSKSLIGNPVFAVWAACLALVVSPVSSALGGEGATRLSFGEIWNSARVEDSGMQASRFEAAAAAEAHEGAKRHLYPRLLGGVKAYSTNDPALSFMSLLGQRALQASDFSPDALGHPPSRLTGAAFLGVDMVLYEGGGPKARAAALGKAREAALHRGKAESLALYSALAQEYARLVVAEEDRAQLSRYEREVESLLSSYTLGTRSNPVGYSGLLGLKAMKNRVRGMLIEVDARLRASRERIRASVPKAGGDWLPVRMRLPEFLGAALPLSTKSEAWKGAPFGVLAARSAADAAEEQQAAASARLLPRVGLFAEGNGYTGERDRALGYTAGAYLSWELFNATESRRNAEARATAQAVRARSEELRARTEAEHATASAAAESIGRTLSLLDESGLLLDEQLATAKKLFRNGAISALQLVEVLGRRTDLIAARSEAASRLIAAHAGAVQTHEGAPYEE